ncbi:molybdenum cofactor guanylyltransferase [Mycobacterium sp. CBMA247]|nr:molybdenum cofactor guanylyltransferase [Mycolicibacterium sp. CBMA 329]MUL90568.1 molybdenum cofactor guanylyltransferase [Mycolicibacterium sp. CBMA 331]MUM00538.1 molybdenum cofactor guanylyltransferase [Mycolicibacterium sp. CBMA 334]MUM25430.1 molybdenum cofactor guanylyltransferase [Mycolicibacterium sp. CBMA 295]MUM41512.1 molybdenum cofactor guanylyltransferase [Mycolicibacterium sp. CBMA 247]MUM45976.1 molybdenum cofactor guanylyltransferase [Mycolicibacterium sp. CBMA 294]
MSTAPLAAVVLAGGASRRMGRDKATLPFDGSTMVERVVAAVSERCSPVFVIAAPGQPLPELELSVQVLRDEVRGVGPLLATGRGLRAAAEAGRDRAFVCAVDMPYLSSDLIDALALPAERLPADIVLPWDGRDHYLAGIYRTALTEQIIALVRDGRRSMRALAESVDTQRIVMAPQRALTNVNSAADLL